MLLLWTCRNTSKDIHLQMFHLARDSARSAKSQKIQVLFVKDDTELVSQMAVLVSTPSSGGSHPHSCQYTATDRWAGAACHLWLYFACSWLVKWTYFFLCLQAICVSSTYPCFWPIFTLIYIVSFDYRDSLYILVINSLAVSPGKYSFPFSRLMLLLSQLHILKNIRS